MYDFNTSIRILDCLEQIRLDVLAIVYYHFYRRRLCDNLGKRWEEIAICEYSDHLRLIERVRELHDCD